MDFIARDSTIMQSEFQVGFLDQQVGHDHEHILFRRTFGCWPAGLICFAGIGDRIALEQDDIALGQRARCVCLGILLTKLDTGGLMAREPRAAEPRRRRREKVRAIPLLWPNPGVGQRVNRACFGFGPCPPSLILLLRPMNMDPTCGEIEIVSLLLPRRPACTNLCWSKEIWLIFPDTCLYRWTAL